MKEKRCVKLKITISGFYGAGNTGDEAILEAILDNLREQLDFPEITVLSLSPTLTAQQHNVQSIYRAWRRENKEKWKALRKSDLLISGGGGLLQDTYPTKIISGPLPYYLLIVFLAKLARTKVMFFSQGIGPVNSRYAKWLMRTFANMADLITVRDKHSKDLLKTLAVTKPETHITSDIVFAFKKKTDNSCYDDLPNIWKERKKQLVSVSVRPWFGNTGYFEALAEGLDILINKEGIYPIFVPMEGIHDVEASEEVINRMEHKDHCMILPTNYTPNQYLNFIANTNLVIGMRLHSLIFATIVNVPHIGISYDPKVKSLLERNDLWPYAFEIDKINSIELANNAQELIENGEVYKSRLKVKAETLRTEAEENIKLLKRYFEN